MSVRAAETYFTDCLLAGRGSVRVKIMRDIERREISWFQAKRRQPSVSQNPCLSVVARRERADCERPRVVESWIGADGEADVVC